MTTKTFYKKFLLALPILFIISFSLLLYLYVDPENFINLIGLENAYILMFLTAFVGGLTTFNFIPYYSIIILLVSAGLNPLYVGAASAVGVMCGDTFSYFVGYSAVV